MRKNTFWEKTNAQKKANIRKQVRRALEGAAKPWTLDKMREEFSKTSDKSTLLRENISRIFPLILDHVAHGGSILYIEKNVMGTRSMLYKFLYYKPRLMAEVEKARAMRLVEDEDPLS